jgi:hypothetical protein
MFARIPRTSDLLRSAFVLLWAASLGCAREIVLGDHNASLATEAGTIEAGEGGRQGVVLWSSDHETGDLSAWQEGGASEGGAYRIDGIVEPSTEQAHRGTYALKATIDTTDGRDHLARVYRRTVDGGAYYSAWFLWPEAHVPAEWWSVFLFRAGVYQDQPNNSTNLWDLYVASDAAGLGLSLFDHLTQKTTPALPNISLPVGSWVHLEAYFAYQPPDGTRITVWVDGVLALDLSGLGEAPSSELYWAIGNGSNGLTPPRSVLYIDDAAISTARLGPR